MRQAGKNSSRVARLGIHVWLDFEWMVVHRVIPMTSRVELFEFMFVCQVIPMTSRVGLIEWMENTALLKEMMYNQLTAAENKAVKTRYTYKAG